MKHICPNCSHENSIEKDFEIINYVCSKCDLIIDVVKNKQIQRTKKSDRFVIKVGQKGVLNNTEFLVIARVERKHNSFVLWREYYLKDHQNNSYFLSESNGNWCLLTYSKEKIKYKYKNAYVNFDEFRWYEDTSNSIIVAEGFFEHQIDFKSTLVSEYVRGTKIISADKENDFLGEHIDRFKVKKAFSIENLPSKTSIGIIQPFFINIKQSIYLLSILTLFLACIQFYFMLNRTNKIVFEDEIYFDKIYQKEYISKSFTLSGSSAPLEISTYCNLTNNWMNIDVSLVNEDNNEIINANKDIEYYEGTEDGSSWSEGSKNETFNICGIPAGKYHLVVSSINSLSDILIPKEGNDSIFTIDKYSTARMSKDSFISIENSQDYQPPTISYHINADLEYLTDYKLAKEYFKSKNKDSIRNITNQNLFFASGIDNHFKIKAEWKQVSYWNFGLAIVGFILIIVLSLIGKYFFEKKKWENSYNSPYYSE